MSVFYDHLKKQNELVGSYGIKFLDDYLLGIKKNDLVLIGAPTGTGKSQLAYHIAFTNSLTKHVHLFALEADQYEPQLRKCFVEYNRICGERNIPKLNYREFVKCEIEKSILDEVENNMSQKYSKLEIHYKNKNFDINTFMTELTEISINGNCELLIIDHIDFFDLLSNVSENYQVTEIMKILREINIKWQIPVVIVSHLRKKQNRKSKIPDIEDLFGTSNKAKLVKTIILLSPDYANSEPHNYRFSTFISIPKDRMLGGTHFIGQLVFNTKLGIYENNYNLLVTKDFGETVEPVELEKYPLWAKEKKPTQQSFIYQKDWTSKYDD